jgi:hypothetical protein
MKYFIIDVCVLVYYNFETFNLSSYSAMVFDEASKMHSFVSFLIQILNQFTRNAHVIFETHVVDV